MRRVIVVAVGFLLLAGCSGSKGTKVTLSGKLTYKDAPVSGVSLVLYPAVGLKEEEPLSIPVAQDGTFEVADVPMGDYKVVVRAAQAPPGLADKMMRGGGGDAETQEKMKKMRESMKASTPFPDKYKDLAKTPLTLKVEKGQKPQELVLTD
jgi:hypothetical protein